ncbi:MAG: chorismate mutase [Rhodococcus sp.]|nr:chorismate mutase [Rhodococcus sp. (in: high G+C Gram-positive bacteria)]
MSLEDVCRAIDALDEQIIALLAQRQRHVQRAGHCSIHTGRALPIEWRARAPAKVSLLASTSHRFRTPCHFQPQNRAIARRRSV